MSVNCISTISGSTSSSTPATSQQTTQSETSIFTPANSTSTETAGFVAQGIVKEDIIIQIKALLKCFFDSTYIIFQSVLLVRSKEIVY